MQWSAVKYSAVQCSWSAMHCSRVCGVQRHGMQSKECSAVEFSAE